jgi:uncharacterized protein DUF6777
MTEDGASTGSGIRISWKALAIPLVVIVVALAGVVGVMALSGDDEAAAAEEIGLEPVSSAGTNPFMPPVGTDQPDVAPPAGTGGTYSGDLVGLYGGTLNQSSCDSQQLVTFLQQNPEKASAWASVVGIQVVDIATYVSELTPVVLRSDTYVTNHGFENGRATPIPTVIQAGTAVLVDKYGTPVTKCYCGNPLSKPPTYATPRYHGPRWSGFTPGGITIIQSTTVIIDTFTLVDTATGEPFTRPRGSDGGSDATSTSTPTTPTTTPPVATVPPVTAAPPTAPPQTVPSGPSAEQRAIAKVQQASSACYPFPAPIEDSNDPPNIFTSPGNDPSSFVLTADGVTVSGNQQAFTWQVDRATLAFTPQNNFAQVASNHCSLLN